MQASVTLAIDAEDFDLGTVKLILKVVQFEDRPMLLPVVRKEGICLLTHIIQPVAASFCHPNNEKSTSHAVALAPVSVVVVTLSISILGMPREAAPKSVDRAFGFFL